MSTVTSPEALIEAVEASDDAITATLTDGRTISVPLDWSWRLFDATPAERRNFRSFVEDRLLRGGLAAEAHPGVVTTQAAGRRRIELGLRGDVSH